jgi:ABC-2 type transport system ATP-binding protein
MTHAISMSHVVKTFGGTVAVHDLDLDIPAGSLYGFIGPNGAGKTTSLRMIMAILFPDRGEISVLGHRSPADAKDRIGYLPEERGVYRKMKVGAFLEYMARLKGVAETGLSNTIKTWLERVELPGVYDKKCEELSKGMSQKVQLVAALVHKPELLILDEPFSGLDPMNTRLLRDLILAEHRRGATVLFSTHVMAHAEELCDHIVMLNRGRKVLDETLGSIRRRQNPRVIRFEPFAMDADTGVLRSVPGVTSITRDGEAFRIDLAGGVDPCAVLSAIAQAVPASRIELQRPSLEDVFLELVQPEPQMVGAAQ